MALLAGAAACAQPEIRIQPALALEAVSDDPDDPAIWINRKARGASLILGTNKAAAPNGALYVWGLDGRIRQRIGDLDRPNNVDVAYGLTVGGSRVDIAVLTERNQSRLRIFAIRDGRLEDIGDPEGTRVFAGESGRRAAPMGIALYTRPRDRALFAIVSRKSGPADGYLWQYRLEDNGRGQLRAVKVREFGKFAGTGEDDEIEAIAVDPRDGIVYYSDETFGVRKYWADPERGAAELGVLAREGFQAQREGIAVYGDWILVTDQIDGGSRYFAYPRRGDQARPAAILLGGADATDGIDATDANLGPRFPRGLLVAMNSGAKNFLVFRGEDLRRALSGRTSPRSAGSSSGLR
jgi:3-phytase